MFSSSVIWPLFAEDPMDVVFTFGACGPNADEVFEKEKDMVSGFLETIKVADTYYGVVEYGEQKANIRARLGDFRNKERLNEHINKIPRSGEGRAIDKALEKARELLLESGRSDARKALVIFANGKSSARLAELTQEAKTLHDAGVKIIAVGIGDDIDDEELNSIATNKILAQPYDEAAPLGHLLAHEVTEGKCMHTFEFDAYWRTTRLRVIAMLPIRSYNYTRPSSTNSLH